MSKMTKANKLFEFAKDFMMFIMSFKGKFKPRFEGNWM